jgi:hypothetical protein
MRCALIPVLLLPALPLQAGTLEGRIVTLHGLAYDDPANPIGRITGRTVEVGQGVEFAIPGETLDNGLGVVPVQVEITPTRIEFTYPPPAGEGVFLEAAFNGYVLEFLTECALFDGIAIDPTFSTLPVEPGDIFADGGALYINLEGLAYGPDARLALDLSVADCPLS